MQQSEAIENMLKENRVFEPPKHLKHAYINSMAQYMQLYNLSIRHPDEFWKEHAKIISWFEPFREVMQGKMPHVKWFVEGKLNACFNCVDRHITTSRKNKVAIIWESESGVVKTFTYAQLYQEICKFANVLKDHDVKKGDRVCIYMPMIPEAVIAMLACARIGAIHSVVFGGFSAKSLQDRINDSQAKVLITADGYMRNGKQIEMFNNANEALQNTNSILSAIIVKNLGNNIVIKKGRDFYWQDLMKNALQDCECQVMDAEDILFVLYTSGTTGKPKGVIHTTGGYLVYAALTSKYVFDIVDSDTYWCTADIGWITGHTYTVYGPLSIGATVLMYESTPTYPKPDRFWEIIEKHKVSIFYTAPTAIRALAKEGLEWPKKHDLSSIRILGTVGEPINPEAWMWYYNNIGNKNCPIVDTWWQTETGGILLSPLPGCTPLKPGSATLPFFGIQAEVYKENGEKAHVNEGGYLVIEKPWPAMIRGIWGDENRFLKTYFSKFPNKYLTGDTAFKDASEYFWIMGRSDDVLKISGHRLGTAEIESAFVSHKSVAEAAVVPVEDKVTGSAIYAFVTLKNNYQSSKSLGEELRQHVAKELGPIAKPKYIQFSAALPKTRSGKIMRRILQKIASGEKEVGDTTTLADPEIVDVLIKERISIN